MSFFGGGNGSGWGPPVPPPHPFFSQPPPPIPVPFFPPGVQPDFSQQQGYNQYVAASVTDQMQYSLAYDAVSQAPVTSSVQMLHQPQQQIQTQHPAETVTVERERRRRSSPQSKHSPPRESDRRDRRQSEKGRSYRDRDVLNDERYSQRKRRSPSPEERGRPRERIVLERNSAQKGSPPRQPNTDKPKVNIDALLQDERLRNVLFAGISKATAKLEQSLKGESESDGKGNLFPSASSMESQKPRSILKRNKESVVGESKTLSALEKTLQMLRGKGEAIEKSGRSSTDRKTPAKGALSQLAAYGEGQDEDQKGSSEVVKKKVASSTHPFWTMPPKQETERKELDSFDVKERMFEEWKQSIGKQSEDLQPKIEMLREKPILKKRDLPRTTEGDNQEELDSTVQNILQSIGFNFDLSRRMQELSRKKKLREDDSGIRNESATFMDKSEIVAELKSSLLQSGADLSSIESLIREARAGSQGSRHSSRIARSPSPGDRDRDSRSSFGRDTRETYDHRAEQIERDDEHRYRSQSQAKYKGVHQWEKASPETYPEHRGASPPRRHFRERVSLSPLSPDRIRSSGPVTSERFRDEQDRNEYFYPDKEFADTPPSVPLLTSYSSRIQNEDLSSGLLKSMRVENFRVMSRPPDDQVEDDSFMGTRRIIMPGKPDYKGISPDNRARDQGSPIRTVTRKRSASPMAVPKMKERRLSPKRSPNHQRRNSRDRSRSPKRPALDSRPPPVRRRSPSPGPARPRDRRRERSRSPYRRRSSRSRSRSRSPYRSKNPRHRSPSHHRKRSSPLRRSPFIACRKSPKRGGSPRPRDKNKPQESSKNSRQNSTKNKAAEKNLSNLTESERKAELQKMLGGKGNKDNAKKGAKEDSGNAKPSDKPKESLSEKDSKVQTVIKAIESMSSSPISDSSRAELIAKATLSSGEQLSKAVTNVASRQAKVVTLKKDLEGLKKVQNELMRKSQRSGLGNKDPHLRANSLAQLEMEKEIDRLSALDIIVDLKSNLTQSLLSIQSKFLKNADSSVVGLATDASSAQTSNKNVKAKDVKTETKADESKKQKSWTSVAVEQESLPEIIDRLNQPDDENKTKGKKSQSTASVSSRQKRNVYYEYVDGGNHWCRECHTCCNAIDQYFNHCHGKKHLLKIKDSPKAWTCPEKESVRKKKVGQAQTRRIKGSEMMKPVIGFYCKLCRCFCGDFEDGEAHIKSDGHHEKYLDYIRDHPKYERELLLAKSNLAPNKKNGAKKKESQPPPPPPSDLLPSSKGEIKGMKSKSHLRQKQIKEEEEKEAGDFDIIEAVDMDLDNDDEDVRDDDVDVKSKVPKMTGKLSNSVTTILNTLSESSANNTTVEMKTSQEDEVTSLGKFLTIAKEEKPSKLPVIEVKKESDLSSIPIPESAVPSNLSSIPLPSTGAKNVTSTVKTLKEVQNEELKLIEEEKRMMGIDVDAEEEKPLMHVKRPPPMLHTLLPDKLSENTEEKKEVVVKPKSLDTLFAKVSQLKNQKVKINRLASSTSAEPSDIEQQIKQEIKEKLLKEKQKLLIKQEKKENRERRLQEKKLQKEKVLSDSSSEETESEEEEATDLQTHQLQKTEENVEINAEPGDADACEKDEEKESDMTLIEEMQFVSKEDNAFEKATVENEETLVTPDEGLEVSDKESTTDHTQVDTTDLEQQAIHTTDSVDVQGKGLSIVDTNLGDQISPLESTEFDVDMVVSTNELKDENEDNQENSSLDTCEIHQNLVQNDTVESKTEIEMNETEYGSSSVTSTLHDMSQLMEKGSGLIEDKVDLTEEAESCGNTQFHVMSDVQKNVESSADHLAEASVITYQKQETVVSKKSPKNITIDDKTANQDGSEITELPNNEPKTAVQTKKNVKKAGTKKKVVKPVQAQSDLLGVLSSNVVAKVAKKSVQIKKKATPKRLGKPKGKPATALEPDVPAEKGTEESMGMDFLMKDFVVLSEVNDDEDRVNLEKLENEGKYTDRKENVTEGMDIKQTNIQQNKSLDTLRVSSEVEEDESVMHVELKENVNEQEVELSTVKDVAEEKEEEMSVNDEIVTKDTKVMSSENSKDEEKTKEMSIDGNTDSKELSSVQNEEEKIVVTAKTRGQRMSSRARGKGKAVAKKGSVKTSAASDLESDPVPNIETVIHNVAEEDDDKALENIVESTDPVPSSTEEAVETAAPKTRRSIRTAHLESDPMPNIVTVDQNVAEEENDKALDNIVDFTDPLPSSTEEAVETVAPKITRRSLRAATPAKTSVENTPERKTRSRGKKTVTTIESDKKDQSQAAVDEEPQEIKEPVKRTLRSRELKNSNSSVKNEAIDVSVEMTAASSSNSEQVENDEMPVDNDDTLCSGSSLEMPTLQPQSQLEDADSDATITEDVDDPTSLGSDLDTQSGIETLALNNTESDFTKDASFSKSTSQSKDPPMSGVVMEAEVSDNAMIPVEEEPPHMSPASEFESLPTDGLNLSLGDDSMDFVVAEMEEKFEGQDSVQ